MSADDQKKRSSQKPKPMPASVSLMYMRAKAYQYYVSGLKSGRRSGISNMFGSAEDLFSDNIELPPTPVVDVAAIDFGSSEEMQWRALFLVDRLQRHADSLMRNHVGRCRSGEYGNEVKKAAQAKVEPEKVKVVIKEFCAVYLYLLAIEQGVLEAGESNQSLQEFFAIAVSVIDVDMPGRSTEEIMSSFDYFDVGKLAQKLSSSIGKHLGFGQVGETAWNDLRKQLLSDGPTRFELFNTCLELPLSEIRASV